MDLHIFLHLGSESGELVKLTESVNLLRKLIMASTQEVLAELNEVQARQTKTASEIAALKQSSAALVEAVAALEAQLAEGNDNVPEDIVAKVAEIKSLAVANDDLIPDLG